MKCNRKLSKEEKGKLSKYKNSLLALFNKKISFKNKRKLFIRRGLSVVPLLTSILSCVIGGIINNNST
jgi:hypothetical protein